MKTFIAVDVETANADLASICSIGLVQFDSGTAIKRLHYLIDPEDHFDGINVSIHGISAEMVAGKPTMRSVYPLLAKALHGHVIAHHMPFDRVALRRAGLKHGHAEIECRWLDTARVARRTWSDIAYEGYALAKVAKRLAIDFTHHNAGEDAYAAGIILTRAIEASGIGLDEWLERSVAPLSSRQHNPRLTGNPEGLFTGETIVFTGALSMPRHEAATLAAGAGFDVAKAVSRSTTVVVVGDQDVRRLAGHEKSTKHREAEALIAKGIPVRIVSEADFHQLVRTSGSSTPY